MDKFILNNKDKSLRWGIVFRSMLSSGVGRKGFFSLLGSVRCEFLWLVFLVYIIVIIFWSIKGLGFEF